MSASVHSTVTTDVSVEQVFSVLTSEEWARMKAERLNDGTQLVRREEKPDGGVVLVVSRELPAGAPGFLERFLPQDGRVVQTDDWGAADGRGRRSGVWSVQIPGAPASLGGTMRIDPTEAGTTYTIDGETQVKVPLIGGRAERYIADLVHRLAAKEADLLRDALHA